MKKSGINGNWFKERERDIGYKIQYKNYQVWSMENSEYIHQYSIKSTVYIHR